MNLEHPTGQMNSFFFEHTLRRFSNQIQKYPIGGIISHGEDSTLSRILMHSIPKKFENENSHEKLLQVRNS